MKTVIVAAALLLTTSAIAADEWYGTAPVPAEAPIAVANVMAALDEHVDQALVVSGSITNVCTNRGCWAVFEDNGEMLRVMARDHSFAMPAEFRGPALAHGVLTRIEVSSEHARHLVDDDGADPVVLEQAYEYRLIADGVLLVGGS